jgi:pimeloyl-ACP methyl ester carboxylesterase
VIGGTLVPTVLGSLYYRRLLDDWRRLLDILEAELIALRELGRAPCERAVRHDLDIIGKGNADLVGHSQGGTVTLAVKRARPEAVRKAVTVGAPFLGSYVASLAASAPWASSALSLADWLPIPRTSSPGPGWPVLLGCRLGETT